LVAELVSAHELFTKSNRAGIQRMKECLPPIWNGPPSLEEAVSINSKAFNMIPTTVTNSRETYLSNAKRKLYIRNLKKKELRALLNNILDDHLDTLDYDSPVQFREAVSDDQHEYGETGFYCLHSGEKIG